MKDFIPMAVIALNGALLGIDLERVREFTDIRRVIPVPCCPRHIIGNMNLRGEILTLVDIRRLLNLPSMGMPEICKAMVVEVEDIVAGVMVEEVRDVMFLLNPQDITAASNAIHSMNEEYLQGIASYQNEILSIVDLPALFLKSGLIVDEAI